LLNFAENSILQRFKNNFVKDFGWNVGVLVSNKPKENSVWQSSDKISENPASIKEYLKKGNSHIGLEISKYRKISEE